MPPSLLMHMLVSMGSQVRPDPPGRWGRNAVMLGVQSCFCSPSFSPFEVEMVWNGLCRPRGLQSHILRRHLAITDVFFPTGMVLSDGSDIISGKKEAPTLVHLVAMSVNKENGDLEGTWEQMVYLVYFVGTIIPAVAEDESQDLLWTCLYSWLWLLVEQPYRILHKFLICQICSFAPFFRDCLSATQVSTCLKTSSYHHQQVIRLSNHGTRSRDKMLADCVQLRYFSLWLLLKVGCIELNMIVATSNVLLAALQCRSADCKDTVESKGSSMCLPTSSRCNCKMQRI